MSRRATLALLVGALFGLGLVIAGMAIPHNVTAFLDVGGAWDPTLAFVMGGAILVYAPVYRIVRARRAPVLAARFHVPTTTAIDRRLVVGAALFGVGWGLSGYCPGPALVGVGALALPAVVFTTAHVVGTAVAKRLA